ncbi:MAG: hypothetical protein GY913_17485 [Proteobacteria bacterium]|nr:hypothetical protein [Pseudomonadota bacterium]
MFLFAMTLACGDKDECTESEYSCDGTILNECVDGVWTESEDCADDGLMCHAEMGHCMAEEDSGMDM